MTSDIIVSINQLPSWEYATLYFTKVIEHSEKLHIMLFYSLFLSKI